MAKKETSAQHFGHLFRRFTAGATAGERAAAEGKMDAWLKRHDKTRADIQSILVQAAKDDEAAQPHPPQSDPRDTATNPFDDPVFTPAGLVEGIVAKYVTMPPHTATIFALWICFTHVYPRFRIAPRVALTSENPNSGKSTALEVARGLSSGPTRRRWAPAPQSPTFSTKGHAPSCSTSSIRVDAEARRRLQQLWNMGHARGAQISLMVGGRRTLIRLHAPSAGRRNWPLPGANAEEPNLHARDGAEYTAETKPEREFDDTDVGDLDRVYIFLRRWAARVNLDPKPGDAARECCAASPTMCAASWRSPTAVARSGGAARARR